MVLDPNLLVELATERDLPALYDVQADSFGHGIQDRAWQTLFPGFDTPTGREKHIESSKKRFSSVTKNATGQPNTIFLKATLPDTNGERQVVGMAIWAQYSYKEGHGTPPTNDAAVALDQALYPDPSDWAFASQLFASMFGKRIDVCKEKQDGDSPAIFALDVCCVHPDHWRKGIAAELVRYGMKEAKARGDLECTTEASVMGRHVYIKQGFQPVAEIEYRVEDEERKKGLPSNLFMRTQPPGK